MEIPVVMAGHPRVRQNALRKAPSFQCSASPRDFWERRAFQKPLSAPYRLQLFFFFALSLFTAGLMGEEQTGVFLTGAPGQTAVTATSHLPSPGAKETEIIHDEQGRPFMAMTHFIVVLEPQATVGQVNAALKSLNARVVGMEKGKDVLEIRIPDPSGKRDLKSIEALATKLERLPVFADALPLTFLGSQ